MHKTMITKHGRFTIKARANSEGARAIAYLGEHKVSEANGTNAEHAIQVVKVDIDERMLRRIEQRRAPHIGTADDYLEAFQSVKLAEHDRLMLCAHLRSPNLSMTATELSRAAGYRDYAAANSIYGRLAKKIGEAVGLKPWEDSVVVVACVCR